MIITKFTSLLLLPLVARAHITLESISSVSVASLASVGGSGYTGAPPPSDTYAPSPGGSDSPTVPAPSPTAPPASPTGSVTATTPRPSSSGGAIDPGRRLKNVTIAANDPRIILSPPEAWTPTPGNICATGGVTNNTLNTTLTTTTPQSFVAFNFTGLALFVNIVSTRQTGVCNMVLDGVDVDGDPNTDGLNTSEQPACVPALARGEGTQYAMDYGAHGLVMTIVGSSPKPESLGGSEVQLDSITYTTYEDEDPSSGGSGGGSAPAGVGPSASPSGGGSNGAKENLAVGFLGVWAITFALFALL